MAAAIWSIVAGIFPVLIILRFRFFLVSVCSFGAFWSSVKIEMIDAPGAIFPIA